MVLMIHLLNRKLTKYLLQKFKDTNLCLLIDLGHLAIAANILKFNRYKF